MSLVGFIGELGLKRMKCNGKWIMTLAGIMACNLSNIAMEWKLSMECNFQTQQIFSGILLKIAEFGQSLTNHLEMSNRSFTMLLHLRTNSTLPILLVCHATCQTIKLLQEVAKICNFLEMSFMFMDLFFRIFHEISLLETN